MTTNVQFFLIPFSAGNQQRREKCHLGHILQIVDVLSFLHLVSRDRGNKKQTLQQSLPNDEIFRYQVPSFSPFHAA